MTDLIESEDELLDPQPATGGGAAGAGRLGGVFRRLRGGRLLDGDVDGDVDGGADGPDGSNGGPRVEADPQRRRRVVQAGALALALVAGASAAGVAVHRGDLHRDQNKAQDRLLLHLLGGGASLTFAGAGGHDGSVMPFRFDNPLPTDLTIGVRNDGARPVEVTSLRIQQPGMDVVKAAPTAVVKPGESVALTTRVAVHCTAPDLPQYPTGGTMTVRTAADAGKPAGQPTDIPLTFTGGTTESNGTTPQSNEPRNYLVGSYVTGNLYHLCGSVLAMMPTSVSTEAQPSTASTQHPEVHYTLHIEGTPGAAQLVAPIASPQAIPGVSSETDLKGPQPIGTSGVDITVTDRITDCAAFGRYVSIRGGASSAVLFLSTASPIMVEAADARFRMPGAQSLLGWGDFGGSPYSDAATQGALLTQLAAACPDL